MHPMVYKMARLPRYMRNAADGRGGGAESEGGNAVTPAPAPDPRDNIPVEFRAGLWGVASLTPVPYKDRDGNDYTKPDKRPRHPADGSLLSVNRPHGGQDEHGNVYRPWATFEECKACGAPAIGKLLRHEDGFVVLDIDVPEGGALSAFQTGMVMDFLPPSYIEYSVSGRGYHAIYRAHLEGGRRGSKADDGSASQVEIYGNARFMLCTGNVSRPLPIADAQPQVDAVVERMKQGGAHEDFIEHELPGYDLTAHDLKMKLAGAKNGPKFLSLFDNGYASAEAKEGRSETDSSFAQMMAYYMPGFEAFLGLFKQSALWRVDDNGVVDKQGYRSERQYVENYILRTYNHAIGRRVARKQHEAMAAEDNRKLAEQALAVYEAQREAKAAAAYKGSTNVAAELATVTTEDEEPQPAPVSNVLPQPTGLLLELATYIYDSSARQNWDIAVATAMTYFAGLVGRACRTGNGSTLTQYTILLAKSGYGKNGAVTAVARIVEAAVRRENGSMLPFFTGPGNIASGQGLRKALAAQPSMFCMLTEFSADWKRMNMLNATTADRDFKRVLLEAFDSPQLGAMAYSDTDKNVEAVPYPNFCFLGDTTTKDFLDGLDIGSVGDGLAPRMLIVPCNQPRKLVNRNAGMPPPDSLLDKLDSLGRSAMTTNHEGKSIRFHMEPDAQAAVDTLAQWENLKYNADSDGMAPIWARVTQKAIRYATLAAVSNWRFVPTGYNSRGEPTEFEGRVTLADAQWGIDIAMRTTQWLVDAFNAGEAGSGQDTMMPRLRQVLCEALDQKVRKKVDYRGFFVGLEIFEVPVSFINRRLSTVTAFKKATNMHAAISQVIQVACREGILHELTDEEREERGFPPARGSVFRIMGNPAG